MLSHVKENDDSYPSPAVRCRPHPPQSLRLAGPKRTVPPPLLHTHTHYPVLPLSRARVTRLL